MPVIVPAAGYTMSGDTSARATGLQRLIDELTTARNTALDRLDAAITTRAVRPGAPTFAGHALALGAQAAGAVLLDSGPLAAGTYRIIMAWTQQTPTTAAAQPIGRVDWEHRNAANAANIVTATLAEGQNSTTNAANPMIAQANDGFLEIVRVFAANERIRLVKAVADGGGSQGGALYVYQE